VKVKKRKRVLFEEGWGEKRRGENRGNWRDKKIQEGNKGGIWRKEG